MASALEHYVNNVRSLSVSGKQKIIIFVYKRVTNIS